MEVSNDSHSRLRSGLHDLDEHLRGFRRGGLILVSGDRYAGRTAFLVSLCVHVAQQGEANVLLISSSPTYQTVERLLRAAVAIDPAVPFRQVEAEHEDDLIILESSVPSAQRIYIGTTSQYRFADLCSSGEVKRRDIGLILVDDISAIIGRGARASVNGSDAEHLKVMAETLQRPIVAVIELLHSTESQPHRLPELSNLDSAVVSHADSVLFMYNPSSFGYTTPDGNTLDCIRYLVLAKSEYGQGWSIHLEYDTHSQSCHGIRGIT